MRHIPTSVELNFLEGLAKRISQKSNQHEEMMSGIQKEISNLLIETQNAYPEYYVQESCREIQYLLEELKRYNVQLDDDMKKKTRNLYETVGIYKASEYEIKKKIDFEKWISNNNDLAINKINQISPNWVLDPVSKITNTNVDIHAKPININPENEIKELQAEKKWLRESSNPQGGNTADFKKLDYDSTAVNMANFRKLDELLLVIDPVEGKDPYEGTQYYYPEDYANIAIIDAFLRKLEITGEEILYIDDMGIEEKKQLATLVGSDWTLYEGREEFAGIELATLLADYCFVNGLEEAYNNWGERPCIDGTNLAFLRAIILQDIENKEEKRLETEAAEAAQKLEIQALQEEMQKDLQALLEKAKNKEYTAEYLAIVADPYNTGTIMYAQDVIEAYLIDRDGGIDAMISRYIDHAPEQIQLAGFYAILPLLEVDFSEMEPEEYVNIMGPIWELEDMYTTYKDLLNDTEICMMFLSCFMLPMSVLGGLEGAVVTAALDTAGDVTSLAISIAKGDQAGTVINIGCLAAPQILEMLKPIKNIEVNYIDDLPDKQVADIIEGTSKSGLTDDVIEEVQSIEKGLRPDPSTYMSAEQITNHLEPFKDGGSYVMTRDQYEMFVEGNPLLGREDNSLFITTKEFMDDIQTTANGNVAVFEHKLGFDPGYFENGGGLVRVDINDPSAFDLRIPSGNELGANEHFIPGGYTSGGTPEAVINQIPNSDEFCSITFME